MSQVIHCHQPLADFQWIQLRCGGLWMAMVIHVPIQAPRLHGPSFHQVGLPKPFQPEARPVPRTRRTRILAIGVIIVVILSLVGVSKHVANHPFVWSHHPKHFNEQLILSRDHSPNSSEVCWQLRFSWAETGKPMHPQQRGEATIWVFRPILQLGRIKDREISGSSWPAKPAIKLKDISGIHQDLKTCRFWGKTCVLWVFYRSMECLYVSSYIIWYIIIYIYIKTHTLYITNSNPEMTTQEKDHFRESCESWPWTSLDILGPCLGLLRIIPLNIETWNHKNCLVFNPRGKTIVKQEISWDIQGFD